MLPRCQHQSCTAAPALAAAVATTAAAAAAAVHAAAADAAVAAAAAAVVAASKVRPLLRQGCWHPAEPQAVSQQLVGVCLCCPAAPTV